MSDGKSKAGREDLPQLKLENQLCFPLYAAARKVVNAYTPVLKPLGLTYTQYIVLLALWETGSATVGDLCRRLYLDCGTMTPMLKKMEESGWIIRSRSREDERVVTVCLTDRGWDRHGKAAGIPEKMAGCSDISAEDARTLHRLLYNLLESMD